jgi:glycerate dehydrogenase
MKSHAVIINTGRGPLVNEQDVADALTSGRLGAFCADVLSTEPPSADNPLLPCQNAFITPHIAWASHEARVRLIHIAAQNLAAFFAGKPINVVSAN